MEAAMHRQGFLMLLPSLKVHAWMITLSLLLAPVFLTACDVAGVSSPPPAMIDIKTYYFQSIAALGQVCKNVPDKTQDWYVLVEVDGIDNSAPGAVNFTFDMKNLILAPNATSSSKDYAEQAYLDNYWQPGSQQNGTITVPAGQKFDNTQVHQAQLFLMNLGPQPDLANTATPGGEVPAVLYTGALFSPEGPRTVWDGANATSSTWNPSTYTTMPATQMGPC
jgi:hypothetical protein